MRESAEMTQADVIVVGGGPGGSSCAWRLRAAGLSVVLLDKAVFPRDKVCAGWITPGVLGTLAIDPAEYAAGRVLQPITAFRTSRMGNAEVLTQYSAPVSYAIRRCEFDSYLVARSGAQLECGVSVERIERGGNRWLVNRTFSASFLVGAGGHFCPVARFLNPELRKEEAVVAQEVEYLLEDSQEAECGVDTEVPELFLCDDLKGYGWCVRKGRYLNVGFGRQDQHDLPAQARRFAGLLEATGRVPPRAPSRWRGHAYLVYGSTARRVSGDGVLLVGDAAGMAYAQSGEGIRPAIESGLLAADAIAAAAYRGERELPCYQRALESRFGARSTMLPGVPSGITAWLAPYLLRNSWFTRRVLLDRWFLHSHQPALGVASL
jgi:flavin-dependent dehydrogenase